MTKQTAVLTVVDTYGLPHVLQLSAHPVTGNWRIKLTSGPRTAHIFAQDEALLDWLEEAMAIVEGPDAS
jgi:hypothetical protein